ncbi:MAG: flavin reductase family protein [Candidatus Rokubacteria bacterium]|nr:flavin reductase family protein [Candidatus Rokubacteria bacterium]MBI2197090.1 flavin reductase family protein [Candidatus Rokubacteria bacterium]MBI3105463.1 flavin reductase family protein [Candidatus Rokubacteria bacterium]
MLGPEEFRRVLGCFASGVTVITTWDPQGCPTGLTASAFSSVSLNPPLVLVCVAHTSQSYPALRASERFAVNILGADQEAISQRFAAPPGTNGSNKFDGIRYAPGTLGLPMLEGALAQLECSTVHAYPGGDHTIFVGQVEAARCQPGSGAEPLLYYRGQYGRPHSPGDVR